MRVVKKVLLEVKRKIPTKLLITKTIANLMIPLITNYKFKSECDYISHNNSFIESHCT